MSNRMRFPVTRALLPVTGALCVLGTVMTANAQSVDCTSLPNPVYIAGSTAVQALLNVIGPNLAAANPPITIVYQGQGSCTGVGYLASPDDTTKNSISGTASYWDTSGSTPPTCNLTAISGNVVDIGMSDVFPASCSQTLPATVSDFHGPVQSMTFVVPFASHATSISAEAAYMVFGFGASTGHAIAPWNALTAIEVRNASSGTQQMISAALAQVGSGFTAAGMQGQPNASSGAVATALENLASGGNADEAIGILVAGSVDPARALLKELAYQHVGQNCGYLPDSTPTAFDKQNTRDGHYAIWGPLHMIARVDSNGVPTSANVKTILDILTGAVEPAFDLLTAEVTAGVVPDCAMRVSRTSEVGPMASYMPAISCECKYGFVATGTAPAGCKTCTKATEATDCTSASASHCNYGYCEM